MDILETLALLAAALDDIRRASPCDPGTSRDILSRQTSLVVTFTKQFEE